MSVTILVGISTKASDETLMEWGSDVAEVSAHVQSTSLLV
jgi:hypothetical protein